MFRTALIAFSILSISSAASAQVVATQHVEKEQIVTDANGAERVRRIIADKVAPGEEVIYSLRYKNDAGEAAEDIVLVMPVPAEISYVEGSVAGRDASVAFSADGGQTYVARGRLTVVEDGVVRPAKDNEITHIKWVLNEPLQTNEAGEVSYRGVLK